MRLPFERFGSLFTRFSHDEPFHLISITGGLELNVNIIYNNIQILSTLNDSLRLDSLLMFIRYEIAEIEAKEFFESEGISVENLKEFFHNCNENNETNSNETNKLVNQFIIILSMRNSSIDYIRDKTHRNEWFQAVYNHMSSCKLLNVQLRMNSDQLSSFQNHRLGCPTIDHHH